jgi:hypothetical protein
LNLEPLCVMRANATNSKYTCNEDPKLRTKTTQVLYAVSGPHYASMATLYTGTQLVDAYVELWLLLEAEQPTLLPLN